MRIWNPATQAQARKRGAYRAPKHSSLIRRLRVGLDLNQPDCARRCGVSLRTFQRAESGDVVPTSLKRQIERALGMAW